MFPRSFSHVSNDGDDVMPCLSQQGGVVFTGFSQRKPLSSFVALNHKYTHFLLPSAKAILTSSSSVTQSVNQSINQSTAKEVA